MGFCFQKGQNLLSFFPAVTAKSFFRLETLAKHRVLVRAPNLAADSDWVEVNAMLTGFFPLWHTGDRLSDGRRDATHSAACPTLHNFTVAVCVTRY